MTILEQIAIGNYDEQLNLIKEACSVRIKQLAVAAGHQLKAGDIVRITNTRPRYLVGLEATVTKVKQTWVEITLHDTVGKFRAGVPIMTPMTCVTKV